MELPYVPGLLIRPLHDIVRCETGTTPEKPSAQTAAPPTFFFPAMTLTCLEGVNSLLREAAGCVATTAWAWDLTPEDCRPENIAPLMGSNWQKNRQTLCSEAQEGSDEAKESDPESMVEVIYDPDWDVYYDPETHEYYELIEEELQK
ncbi:unnamed protein product [Symbiodinium natans]|uniref:Uncharacterized protein n=1 Tax=Symbiodinium natans TaxID=878477 RepID=A0A812KK74_9DINO|nr:unnamed protein product [Symbiodinium natans]